MAKKRASRKVNRGLALGASAVLNEKPPVKEDAKELSKDLPRDALQPKLGRTHKLAETGYRKVRETDKSYGRDARSSLSYKRTSYTRGGR